MTKRILLTSLSLSLLISHSALQAAGFAIIENSASGMGNAFAGAAAVGEDASTVWFNPAAMSRLGDRPVVSVSSHIIIPSSDFSDRGSSVNSGLIGSLTGKNDDPAKAAFVPNLYYVRPINEKMHFGIGVNAPFGLEVTYDDDWIGRYIATKSEMKTININPSLSWKTSEQLSFGAGVSLQYIDVKLGSAVNSAGLCQKTAAATANAIAPGDNATLASLVGQCASELPQSSSAADSKALISGDDISYGFNLGLLYQPTTKTRVGASYRSKVNHTLEGDADFTVNSALTSFINSRTNPTFGAFLNGAVAGNLTDINNITADASLPESLSLSVAHNYNDKLELLGDVTWTGWSSFNELRVKKPDGSTLTVTPEEWDDVYRVSFGGNYKYSDHIKLRAGVAYDESPIPNPQLRTPRIPGNDRTWVSFGVGYKVNKKMDIDVGYSHLFVDETAIDHTDDNGTNIKGVYDAKVDILSAQLNWKF